MECLESSCLASLISNSACALLEEEASILDRIWVHDALALEGCEFILIQHLAERGV